MFYRLIKYKNQISIHTYYNKDVNHVVDIY